MSPRGRQPDGDRSLEFVVSSCARVPPVLRWATVPSRTSAIKVSMNILRSPQLHLFAPGTVVVQDPPSPTIGWQPGSPARARPRERLPGRTFETDLVTPSYGRAAAGDRSPWTSKAAADRRGSRPRAAGICPAGAARMRTDGIRRYNNHNEKY